VKRVAHDPTPSTSTSLLGRLRQEPADQEAWAEFVRRYGPQVYRWCRRWGLQEADAEDVTQAVLVRLSARMRTFTHDPARSFRAYLMTLARYAWCDFLETRKQPGAGVGGSDVLGLLETVEAGDDLVRRLDEQFDQEVLVAVMRRLPSAARQESPGQELADGASELLALAGRELIPLGRAAVGRTG
jgi:RNA polymerase sigma-70 factor (ECF subfamily)